VRDASTNSLLLPVPHHLVDVHDVAVIELVGDLPQVGGWPHGGAVYDDLVPTRSVVRRNGILHHRGKIISIAIVGQLVGVYIRACGRRSVLLPRVEVALVGVPRGLLLVGVKLPVFLLMLRIPSCIIANDRLALPPRAEAAEPADCRDTHNDNHDGKGDTDVVAGGGVHAGALR